jgi:transcriptional regulator GlxA family with amidase domain
MDDPGMTPMAPDLRLLGQQLPVRVLLINAGPPDAITWAALAQPLLLAAASLGPDALQIDIRTPQQATHDASSGGWHIALLAADAQQSSLPPALLRAVVERCRVAPFRGAVGAAVLWLLDAGAFDGVRTALPWAMYADAGAGADRAILTPHLFEIDGRHLSCCGGAASIDFSLTLIELLFGAALQADIMEALCVERVRGQDERQRVALQARFGVLQPKLTEAVTLMEANLEEPLSTDDIASLVGLSRRQLERLFKQFLGRQPSRYYLELRLTRSRQLLQGTHHSIVQVGLMCGFSSGSHFSTAFGALFGNTPRQERQRKLAAPGLVVHPI